MTEELRLSVEKLVYGGDGLAHADGNTVFVPYVLPGESIRAAEKSKKKKVVWASLLEVTASSKERIAAPCPHFQSCGGCHYQHIAIAEQIRLKKEILRETLSRIGGVEWAAEIREHTAAPFGYRNRAQWAARKQKPRALGYFHPASSDVVPIDECRVLSPLLAATFQMLQNMARDGSLPQQILEIEAFADSKDEKIALNVAFERFPKAAADLAAGFRGAIPEISSLLLLDQEKDKFELTGPGHLIHEAGGFQFRVSHLSFFQVNRFLVEDLLRTMTAGAKGGTALDLYAGVGFFTLPLAKTFQRVIAVDANLAATRDLQENAHAAGVSITLHSEHTEDFLRRAKDQGDFVALDPPRAGLGAKAAASLAELGAAEMAYLSCDPATLARDLAVLTNSPRRPKEIPAPKVRYEISELHFFDLFPQTYHIETLAKLKRVS
ncbi:MAG TPA: 23S rRNA (uracil(1939)-C(5))-methyltransferase RlmD [Candidatus Acidoferrum sp.]|nr:23S rRNA (uracil(1939)-C(5))-methyltransferase RlmD [Candidatus Acidoferrum sp.]